MPETVDPATIAYFTVVADERTGWTGGLLLLSRAGRPLEFQCTLPVRPSRAHEILFGPSLRDHLISEVIGPLLIRQCRMPMSLLCCDQPEALNLQPLTKAPVTLVCEAAEGEEGPITDDMLIGCESISLAGATLRTAMENTESVKGLARQFDDLPDGVEPFERIREAIKEAHSQIARSQRAA